MITRLFKFFVLGVLLAGAGVFFLREDLKITMPSGLIEHGVSTAASDCEQRTRYPTHIEIDGETLPYYPGHTYFVNGKTFKTAPEKSSCVDRAEVVKQTDRGMASASSEFRVERLIDAYRPSNIKNMMQTIDKAKKRAKERKEVLDEFAR